jgi:hypothetical protein
VLVSRSVLESENAVFCRGVAQPGSAPALGAGGRWFKSNRPDHLSSRSGDPRHPHLSPRKRRRDLRDPGDRAIWENHTFWLLSALVRGDPR